MESQERTANLTRTDSVQQEREMNERQSWKTSEYKNKRLSSAAALHAVSYVQHPSCISCKNSDHKSNECNMETIEEKKKKLKRQGRCLVCLGTRHIARKCRAQGISCEKHARRHLTFLCHEQLHEAHQHASTSPAVSAADALITASPCSSDKSAVLLQTATTWVETPTDRVLTQCLMDGGSMRSFIREDVSRALKLPVTAEETINLYTFGSDKPRQAKYQKVKAELKNVTDGQTIEIQLLESPQVCISRTSIAGEALRKELELKRTR